MTIFNGVADYNTTQVLDPGFATTATGSVPGLYDDRTFSDPGTYLVGTPVSVQFTPASATQSGNVAESFFDNWYYRVHIIPGSIAFGNVLSGKNQDFSLWSGFFTDKSMTAFSGLSSEGLSITTPVSPTYAVSPLEEIEYTVSVTLSGPPSISDTVTWTISGEDYSLPITGQRVVVWPFMAQINQSDVWEWKTNIITTYNREQRFCNRPVPRRAISYEYQLSPKAFSRARAIAQEWAHRIYGVPVWSEGANVGAVSSGATSITTDTTTADYRVGGLCLVWDSDSSFEAVEIDAVNSGSLDLVLSVSGSYTNAYVCPLQLGRTPSGVSFQRTGYDYAQSSIQFLIIDNVDLSDTSPYPTYRSHDVMTDRRVVIGDLSERIARNIQVIDNGVNLDYDPLEGAARYMQTMTWYLKDQSEVWALTKWLHGIKGKQKSFWLPTWHKDLVLVSTIASGSLTMTVEGIDYNLYLDTTDILIRLTDGTSFYRRVSGSTVSGSNEILSFDSQLGQDVDPEDVAFICFMNLVRFDVDSIEFQYNGDQASVTAPITTVNQNES